MIFQTDVLLKTLLEENLEQIKLNPWLIDQILWDFTHSQFLKDQIWGKTSKSAHEWFETNKSTFFINLSRIKRNSRVIAITLGSSTEVQEFRTMADVRQHTVGLAPTVVGQKIPYVVQPFIPYGYDPTTGEVGVPTGIDIVPVSPGMVLLNPVTGNGTPIIGINGQNIMIKPGVELDAVLLELFHSIDISKPEWVEVFFKKLGI